MKFMRAREPFVVTMLASLLCSGVTPAMSQASPKQASGTDHQSNTGSISGYVYCQDTGAPARLAAVTLQPLSSLNLDPRVQSAPSKLAVTALDGTFRIKGIDPGDYLVLAWLPGYLSPLASFTQNEVLNEHASARQKLIDLLPRVTVQQGQVASVQIALQRGAEISGTVSYDDGSPVAVAPMQVFRREDKSGQWQQPVLGNSFFTQWKADETNQRGKFLIAGLPPGKYLLSASVPTQSAYPAGLVNSSFGETTDPSVHGKLQVYFGGKLREKDAKTIEVGAQEQRTDVDIVVPLSKLHSLSGTVISGKYGHPIKQGIVELLYADDSATAQRFYLGSDEASHEGAGTFRFNYVLDGEYSVRVLYPSDDGQPALQSSDPGDGVQNLGRRYGDAQVNISFQGDTTGLVIAVQDLPRKQVDTP
jgi:hypothetical protein